MPAAPRPGQRHGPAPRWGQRVKRMKLPARAGPGSPSWSVPQTGRQRQPVPRTGLGWEREENLLGPYLGLDVSVPQTWTLQCPSVERKLLLQQCPSVVRKQLVPPDDHVMTNLYSGWPSCLLLSSFFWPRGRSLRWPLLSTISSSLHSSRGSPCTRRPLLMPTGCDHGKSWSGPG